VADTPSAAGRSNALVFGYCEGSRPPNLARTRNGCTPSLRATHRGRCTDQNLAGPSDLATAAGASDLDAQHLSSSESRLLAAQGTCCDNGRS
jgi:hypothetical protein